MDEGHGWTSSAAPIDRRIRHAMRILENEQTPLPETAEVAARVGLSPFHFVRLFTAQLGLSPQDYGRSTLLMCAAGRLRYSDDPIDIVSKDFGYSRQAAFNKAFTRFHGVPPARWRRRAQAEIVRVSGAGVRLSRFPARLCLARRYFGPPGLGPARWADFIARVPEELRGWPRMDFAYDDPRNAPPARIRHDCALAMDDGFALPEALAEDGFEMLESPAGLWAVAEAPASRLRAGYRAVFDGWFQDRRGFAMEGDPYIERYGTTPGGEPVVSVCVRVRPIASEGHWNMAVLKPDAETGRTP